MNFTLVDFLSNVVGYASPPATYWFFCEILFFNSRFLFWFILFLYYLEEKTDRFVNLLTLLRSVIPATSVLYSGPAALGLASDYNRFDAVDVIYQALHDSTQDNSACLHAALVRAPRPCSFTAIGLCDCHSFRIVYGRQSRYSQPLVKQVAQHQLGGAIWGFVSG